MMLTHAVVHAALARLASAALRAASLLYSPDSPAAFLAALALLAAMGGLGIALLRRFTRALDPLEQAAYGFTLGVVVASLALLVLACLLGLSTILVVAVGTACAIGAAVLRRVPCPKATRRGCGPLIAGTLRRASLFVVPSDRTLKCVRRIAGASG
ncbi:MAG TPA: hypothetical protein VFZ66_17365 [Herpetosiphonaceae bacterium]